MTDLAGTLVAVSISEPPPRDLAERGLSPLHVTQAFTETVRHLLAAGAGVAYGGWVDYRLGTNFTTTMLDMVSAYRSDLQPGPERVVIFVAAPDAARQPEALKAFQQRYAASVSIVRSPDEPLHGVPPGVSDGVRLGLAYTAMREDMVARTHARVMLGGKLRGYAGRYPGVIEEAVLTMAAGSPLYVAGGFGGAAAAFGRLLSGEPGELREQLAQSEVRERRSALAGSPYAIDLDGEVTRFTGDGWARLNNGLDDDENERLAVTSDVDELVALVLRGLFRVRAAAVS